MRKIKLACGSVIFVSNSKQISDKEQKKLEESIRGDCNGEEFKD